ncbi:MAG TPA: arsenite methyltransferase [Candidatus Krumholzibacteria bacterium]|nr:arsenite methyltransferase [Candidatus Krumholzibacteria bacterium]HPD70546.1 arsenite methyltransferase [Candidatus Krumholzibacteria bacterium]HRY39754.1 arsenite methyltransferase [Candidatus Krumholzibacteria bacterium]
MNDPRTYQQHLDVVRERYATIASGAESSCCSGGQPLELRDAARALGYSEDQLASLPDGQHLTLGCGNPLAAALLEPGQTVLDLGSGAGFDCFLAAQQVGETGHVIGVDMTAEMIARARAAAAKAGHANVEFRLGELSHLPVADATVDVILSNCVVNLVPDKAQVFREAHRVLKSGGRLAISDVVRFADFPPDVLANDAALCACISGAATVGEYEAALRAAGFTDIRIVVNDRSGEFIKDWEPGSGAERYVRSALIEARR